MSLIEWRDVDDIPQRSWIPEQDVTGGLVVNPEAGIPYGLDFSEFVVLSTTPEILNREMRKAGIWTLDDIHNKPQIVQGAIVAAYGITMQSILREANRIEKELLGK